MATKVDIMIEGGKATPAPPLGPALAPLGVNVGGIVEEINKKTENFKGMQVPVTVNVNDDKSFEIEVGIPPVTALIKKELSLEKGSGRAGVENVADIVIEQVIKVAKQKEDGMLGANLKVMVKQIIGTCGTMGILVEGTSYKDALKLVDEGKWDKEIKEEKTELSEAELANIKKEREAMQKKIEKEHAKMKKKAEKILKEMEGKEDGEKRKKMREEEILDIIIEELVPHESAAAGAPVEAKKE